MGVRNLVFALSLQDRVQDRLLEVRKQLLDLDGTTATPLIKVGVVGQEALTRAKSSIADAGQSMKTAATPALGAMSNLASSTKDVKEAIEQAGSTSKNAFGQIRNCLDDTTSAAGRLIGSFAAMAVGGAVMGMTWIGAAQSKLYKDQVIEAITANKKLKISSEDLNEYLGKFRGVGWTSDTKMIETLQAASLFGGKQVKNREGLEKVTTSAETVAFAKQESVGYTGAELLGVAGREGELMKGRGGQMGPLEKFKAATADIASTTDYESKLKTPEGRLKLLNLEAEKGGVGGKPIDIKAELDQRPWIEAQQNIVDLQKAIGESLGGPMRTVSGVVAGFAKILKDMGAAPWIGWGAMLLGVAGAASMLISVFTPLIAFMGAMKAAMFGQSAATTLSVIATKAEAAAQMEEAIATAMSSQAGVKDTVIQAQNTIAKRARGAADLAAARASVEGTAATNGGIVASIRSTAVSWSATISAYAHAMASAVVSTATWAQAAATWAVNTAMDVAIGTTTATSAVLGVMTAASLVATGGFTALATAIWAALSPFLPLIIAGVAIAGILALVATKAGLLGPLLKGLGSINLGKVFGDLGKGDVGKAWKDLTKGFKLPSLAEMWGNLTSGLPDLGKLIKLPDLGSLIKLPTIQGALTVAMGPFGLILKPLVDLMTNSVEVQNVIRKLIEIGLTIFQKIADFTLWVWHGILDLPKKIADAIKGAPQALVNAATGTDNTIPNSDPKKMGDNVLAGAPSKGASDADLQAYATAKARQFYPDTKTYSDEQLKPVVSSMFDALKSRGTNEEQRDKDRLNSRTPVVSTDFTKSGFATADNAINRYNKELIPSGSQTAALSKATGNFFTPFVDALSSLGAWVGSGANLSDLAHRSTTGEETNEPSATAQPASSASIPKSYLNGINKKDTINPKVWQDLAPDQRANWIPQYAVGARFGTKGFFGGIVDRMEEIIPQATAEKGPGPISRALATLYDMDAGNRNGQQQTQREQSSQPIVVNFNIGTIEKDVDVDAFMFKARGELERLTTRNGGYRRGGAVGR